MRSSEIGAAIGTAAVEHVELVMQWGSVSMLRLKLQTGLGAVTGLGDSWCRLSCGIVEVLERCIHAHWRLVGGVQASLWVATTGM